MREVCDDLQDEAVDFASFSGFFAVPLQIFESITARRTGAPAKYKRGPLPGYYGECRETKLRSIVRRGRDATVPNKFPA